MRIARFHREWSCLNWKKIVQLISLQAGRGFSLVCTGPTGIFVDKEYAIQVLGGKEVLNKLIGELQRKKPEKSETSATEKLMEFAVGSDVVPSSHLWIRSRISTRLSAKEIKTCIGILKKPELEKDELQRLIAMSILMEAQERSGERKKHKDDRVRVGGQTLPEESPSVLGGKINLDCSLGASWLRKDSVFFHKLKNPNKFLRRDDQILEPKKIKLIDFNKRIHHDGVSEILDRAEIDLFKNKLKLDGDPQSTGGFLTTNFFRSESFRYWFKYESKIALRRLKYCNQDALLIVTQIFRKSTERKLNQKNIQALVALAEILDLPLAPQSRLFELLSNFRQYTAEDSFVVCNSKEPSDENATANSSGEARLAGEPQPDELSDVQRTDLNEWRLYAMDASRIVGMHEIEALLRKIKLNKNVPEKKKGSEVRPNKTNCCVIWRSANGDTSRYSANRLRMCRRFNTHALNKTARILIKSRHSNLTRKDLKHMLAFELLMQNKASQLPILTKLNFQYPWLDPLLPMHNILHHPNYFLRDCDQLISDSLLLSIPLPRFSLLNGWYELTRACADEAFGEEATSEILNPLNIKWSTSPSGDTKLDLTKLNECNSQKEQMIVTATEIVEKTKLTSNAITRQELLQLVPYFLTMKCDESNEIDISVAHIIRDPNAYLDKNNQFTESEISLV